MQILTNNPSLSSVSQYRVCFESPHAPKLAIINRTGHVHLLQELSRASSACSIATQQALRYSTYIVLLSNTIGESFPCVLCTNKLHVRLYRLFIMFSPQDFILTFEPCQSNPTLVLRAFLSFVMFSALLAKGGRDAR